LADAAFELLSNVIPRGGGGDFHHSVILKEVGYCIITKVTVCHEGQARGGPRHAVEMGGGKRDFDMRARLRVSTSRCGHGRWSERF
jgi:hypothetical protein